ncbi:hypothetical protein F4778DRAFT_520458 [Xylariomycetidae sp. FL2044]|nr:hypothetical protein F4778DRAFT_520458 [Xylariomycetidae sp. FL2044]
MDTPRNQPDAIENQGLEVAPFPHPQWAPSATDPPVPSTAGAAKSDYEAWTGHETGKRRWVWLLPASIAALLAALIVGAAVGGGVGASLSKCRQSQAHDHSNVTGQTTTFVATPTFSPDPYMSTTSPPSSTGTLLVDYAVAPAPAVENLSVDCEALRKRDQIALLQDKFSIYCKQDVQSGLRLDPNNEEVILSDVALIVAYSFEDCILACSVYNAKSSEIPRDEHCRTTLFRTDLNFAMQKYKGNCWLKNATAVPADNPKDTMVCETCILAVNTL